MSLPYLCPILAQKIRLSKDNSKIINSSFSQRVCVYGPMLEVKISDISCKLKPTYVFVFVLSAILDASILEPKISTRYHVYDCVNILRMKFGSSCVCDGILFSRCPSVRPSFRPSLTFWFLYKYLQKAMMEFHQILQTY